MMYLTIKQCSRIIAILLLVLLTACNEQIHRQHSHRGLTMGTSWSVKLVEPMGATQWETLVTTLTNRLNTLEAMMSTYRDDSAVSHFNNHFSTEWQSVPKEVLEVVTYAQTVSRLSGGAFDITVDPLVELWGFGKANIEHQPSADAIQKVSEQIGYQHLYVRNHPPALRKDVSKLRINLSAIAKGYAVDQLADILHDKQLHHYLLEIGGELRASGVNENNQPWTIGIEKPMIERREVMKAVNLDGVGIATSGDYRNFMTFNNQRYSHAIDPRSLNPIPYKGVSVTVIADTAMQADAWSTALFVLNEVQGMTIASKQRLGVYYIENSKPIKQTMNERFSQYIATDKQ